jgi:hypothetical protein
MRNYYVTWSVGCIGRVAESSWPASRQRTKSAGVSKSPRCHITGPSRAACRAADIAAGGHNDQHRFSEKRSRQLGLSPEGTNLRVVQRLSQLHRFAYPTGC